MSRLFAAWAAAFALGVGSDPSVRQAAPAEAQAITPWVVGERLEYGMKFGFFNVGRGTIEVLGIDTIRGEPCYHVLFVLRGGALGYSIHDSLQSWFGVNDLVSRRFVQDNDENGRMRYRHYEIYPDRRMWVRNETDSGAAAPDPLDDASFFYFARTVPLEDRQTYVFNRYFMADRNPVTIRVIQRQTISVPAGRFRTVAVQPIFRSRGMFSQGGQAVIWFTDDSARIPVRIRASLPVGTLELSLRSRN